METWPSLAIIGLFVAVIAGSMLLAPYLGNWLGHRLGERNPEARHAAAYVALTVIGPLTAVFLSFALVQSMGEYRRAETAVGHEAGDVLQLDRVLAVAPNDQGRAARLLLRLYARNVVAQEWPAMRAGHTKVDAAHETFAALQAEIERSVGEAAQRGHTNELLLKNLDDVHDDRTARLGGAAARLPSVLWWAASSLLLLMLVSSAGLQATGHWMTVAAMYGAALAVLAACFYILDGPYMGDVSVSAQPIANAIQLMEARLH